MLPSRKVNQIMMASCCAPCVETCGSNIPQIRANDVLFPLLLVFSVRSSLCEDTVTDFVVDVLSRDGRGSYFFHGAGRGAPPSPRGRAPIPGYYHSVGGVTRDTMKI